MFNKKSLRVAYVGPIAIPNGGAAARRILGIASAIREAGHEVIIGSGQMQTPGSSMPSYYDQFPVYSLSERTHENYPVLLKHLAYTFMGLKTKKWLMSLNPQPDIVILYSEHLPYWVYLSKWCKSHKIPLIFDAVEWYDPRSMPGGGAIGPYRLSFELTMRWFAIRSGYVIAISTYLEKYFSLRGCNVLKIPPTLKISSLNAPRIFQASMDLRLVYSGKPGKKDRLDKIIEAVLQAATMGLPVRLLIAGVNQAELLNYMDLSKFRDIDISKYIINLGSISHEESIKAISESDFSVLLRSNDRTSNAGFPTKVVESLAVSTPVISNITSDLGSYLHDGVNSLICNNDSVEELVNKIFYACSLPIEIRNSMRIAAKQTAYNSFDSSLYSSRISDFLHNSRAQYFN